MVGTKITENTEHYFTAMYIQIESIHRIFGRLTLKADGMECRTDVSGLE